MATADLLSRIDQRLKALGLTAAAASGMAGLSRDAIRNMRRAAAGERGDGISTKTLAALASVLQTSQGWLLEGIGPETAYCRIIGRVGADPSGEIIFSTGQETGDMVPPPPGGTSDSLALEVVGHSMRGIAEDGSLIYFEEQRNPPTPDMLGYPTIVETEDGRVLLKRLLKGSRPGLYDLESANGPLLEDQRLVWAAEIIAIIPPKRARRIIIRSGTMDAA